MTGGMTLLVDMRPECCGARTRLVANGGSTGVQVCRFDALEECLACVGEADGVEAIVAMMRPMGALLPQRKARGIHLLLPFCELGEGCACGQGACGRCRATFSAAQRRRWNAAAAQFLRSWDLRGCSSCAAAVVREGPHGVATAGGEDGGGAPPPRMFSAAKAVELAVPVLAAAAPRAADPPGAVLFCVDLACGSGRDLTFLAEELRSAPRAGDSPWRFVGVDHHARHGTTLSRIAANRGVGGAVSFVESGDLRRPGVAEAILDRIEDGRCFEDGAGGAVAAVVVCRFLDRGLLSRVASRLRRRGEGAALIVSAFEGIESCLAHGHPKRPRDVLGDGELASELLAGWNADCEGARGGQARGGENMRWEAAVDVLAAVEDGSGRATREFVARYTRAPPLSVLN